MLSVIWFIVAIIEASRVAAFQKNSLATQGTVIRLEPIDEGIMPIVEYKTQTGERHELRVGTQVAGQVWTIGSVWPVRYVAHQPSSAKIDQPAQQWRRVALFALVGAGLVIVGFVARFIVNRSS